MDINTKKLKKNAFRITKERGLSASRVRVPGGFLKAEHLLHLHKIADEYGNGTLHLTTRQGFEIPGIPFKDIPKVNELLQPLLDGLDINHDKPNQGYPSAGTRNISACIGNRVCPFANVETSGLAKRIEKEVSLMIFTLKLRLQGVQMTALKCGCMTLASWV